MAPSSAVQVKLKDHYDLVVIGGGINGTTVAREGSARGLSVLLCQASDLATGYSSAQPYFLSANLRNLRRFRLTNLANDYDELKRLQQLAPYLMRTCPTLECFDGHWSWPLLNTLHNAWQQPVKKPAVAAQVLPANGVRIAEQGFQTNASRFTLANALQAKKHGAHIVTRHALLKGVREHGLWHLSIQANASGQAVKLVSTPVLVNATGPHVHTVLNTQLNSDTRAGTLLLRLTHLVVPNSLNLSTAVFYHRGAQRLGLIPINEHWLHFGPLITAAGEEISNEDIAQDEQQLLAELNQCTQASFSADDIAQCRSGLRAVCDDGNQQDLSDLVLDIDCPDGQSPLVNLFGGDLLHHLSTAERVFRLLSPYLPSKARRAGKLSPLPGAGFSDARQLLKELASSYPKMPNALLQRLSITYGDASFEILGQTKTEKDLGRDFGHGLHQKEVDYLVDNEWAQTAADILERRTSLSWDFTAAQAQELEEYLVDRLNS